MGRDCPDFFIEGDVPLSHPILTLGMRDVLGCTKWDIGMTAGWSYPTWDNILSRYPTGHPTRIGNHGWNSKFMFIGGICLCMVFWFLRFDSLSIIEPQK